MRWTRPRRPLQKISWPLVVLGVVALIGWRAAAGLAAASAHALLVRSIPAADAQLQQSPPQAEMWFNEPLEAGFSQVRLLTSSGREIPLESPELDPADPTHLVVGLGPLPSGIYTLAWENLSQTDGHTWTGSFPFTVLNPDGSLPAGSAASAAAQNRSPVPGPGESLARWLALLGGALFFGAAMFQLLVTSPARQARDGQLHRRAQDLAWRAVWGATAMIILGTWLQILFQALQLGGLERLPALLLETRIGVLGLARQGLALSGLLLILNLPQPRSLAGRTSALLGQSLVGGAGILLLVLLILAPLRGEATLTTVTLAVFGLAGTALILRLDDRTSTRMMWPAFALVGAVMLFTYAGGSHARAVSGSAWAVLMDYIHLAAAATWVGGLVLLAMLAWRVRPAEGDRAQLLDLVRRFSFLAILSVLILAVTGLFSSAVQLPGPASLVRTPYGWVLLAKLSLVGLALAVAGLNNRLVHRRDTSLQDEGGRRRFSRQVAVEVVASLGIMISVAVLTQTTTPRNFIQEVEAQKPAAPFSQVVKADDLYVDLQVKPNQAGRNTFVVHLYHPDQSSIGDVQLVRLFLNYRDEQLGQTEVDLRASSLADFSMAGAYLSQGGNWDLSVYVRRRGLDDVLAHYALVVPAPPGPAIGDPWQNPLPGLPLGLIIAGALGATGLIALVTWVRTISTRAVGRKYLTR